ncbi:hypothetical protein [Streptomyces enissocaesilis]|uniref:Uncharacterized protein n=1 Tax=Streptomyces enissocaesilis TaxID=332589 RepID=A0ABP6JY99_9ACTN
MIMDRTSHTETAALTAEVEGLLDSAEPEGFFRDTRECQGGLALLGGFKSSPPTPRPKKETR